MTCQLLNDVNYVTMSSQISYSVLPYHYYCTLTLALYHHAVPGYIPYQPLEANVIPASFIPIFCRFSHTR